MHSRAHSPSPSSIGNSYPVELSGICVHAHTYKFHRFSQAHIVMYFCNLLFSPNILFLGFIHNSISFSVLLVSLYKYAENYLLMVLLMNIKFFPFFTITNNAADIFLVHIPICMYAGLSLGNLVVELLGCSTCAPLAFLGWLNALQRSSSK